MVQNNNKGGRSEGQKYKSLLVWQFLLKHTDENHSVTLNDIVEHLKAYNITADRHSVSRDIRALQNLMDLEYEMDEVELDEREKLRYSIEFNRGCKIVSRPYAFEDLRLLAECIPQSLFQTAKSKAY